MKSLREFLPESWDIPAVQGNAAELNVGDDVIITGPVEFKGSTGVIDSFDNDKSFVVVNLYNHGKRSFHSSDVSSNDYANSDEEAAEMYDRDPDARAWSHDRNIDESIGLGAYDKAYELGKSHGITGQKRQPPWPKEPSYSLYHKAYEMGYKDWRQKPVKKVKEEAEDSEISDIRRLSGLK